MSALRVLPFALALLVGCTGPSGDDKSDTGADDTGADDTGPGDTDTAETDPPADIQWAGTWTFELAYSVTCDHGFGNMQTAEKDKAHSVQITGANDALAAEIAIHYMLNGSGDNDGFTLSGTFPFEGSDDQDALTTPTDNEALFRVTTVTDDGNVSGEVSGEFDTSFVGDCELADGTFVATR